MITKEFTITRRSADADALLPALRPGSRSAFILVFLAGLTVLYFIPEHSLFDPSHTSLCLLKFLTGFDCPGCGMTRALYLLLHLRCTEAFHFNAAVFFLAAVFIMEVLQAAYPFPAWIAKGRTITHSLFAITLLGNYAIKIHQLITHS